MARSGVVVASLVITLIAVVFTVLLMEAGAIQVGFASISLFLYSAPPQGIIDYMTGSMVFSSMLGPPLSWGVGLLNMLNSNWWLNNYMAWYIIMMFFD
ncbi:MAG: hypothetical protein ACTSSA_07375 [Candidatus Freyarchaeota archaeon]